MTGTYWQVYRLGGDHSTFLLALIASVWTNRWNRHCIIIVTQTLFMVESSLLACVAFSGQSGT